MTRTLVHRIYSVALVAGLCATFIGIALLLSPMFEGMSPAHEIRWDSGSYGELPPVW
jgi:hypothetical protein